MRIAIIPARGGSKRIPRKNIRSFGGKPIIGWSIEAAIDSGCFDRIIVSTDDAEIAHIACSFGAQVPFVRPMELSDDFVPTGAVIEHAIKWCNDAGADVGYACCLYATAPFVTPDVIREGADTLATSTADFVVSVTSFPFPIQRACMIREGRLALIDESQYLVRSQDLEETFHDAGQFYWGRADAWLQQKPIFGSSTAPLVLPRHRVQDIDTLEDWKRAELLFEMMIREQREEGCERTR